MRLAKRLIGLSRPTLVNPEPLLRPLGITDNDLVFGYAGVDLFFVLSGLVIVHSSLRRSQSAGAFMLGRIARLFATMPIEKTWEWFDVRSVVRPLSSSAPGLVVRYEGGGLRAYWNPRTCPRARLHLYGKAEARRGRKMGHLTLVGGPLPRLLDDARALAPLIAQVVPE